MNTKRQNRKQLLIEKLIAARKKAGLTQLEAAKKLDKPQSFISKIESGERNIDFLELEDLASIYNQQLSFFETYDEEIKHESN